jgi:hypothetical protein
VRQPITNLGHHVRAIEDLPLALLLFGCEHRCDRQEPRVDVSSDLCVGEQTAQLLVGF